MISTIKNDKTLKYIHKYKRIMKHFTKLDLMNAQFKLSFKKIFFDIQLKILSKALKSEDYETRKQFVEAICDFLDTQTITDSSGIHPHLFDKIVVPVFIVEYKKNNAKYIKWIGQCDNLIRYGKNDLLRQINALGIAGDFFAHVEYFCGKSFMLDKNQNTLDIIMEMEEVDVLLYRMDFPGAWIRCPDRYLELVKEFSAKLERCKEYCKISCNDKWDKFLADWELLVNHLYKYEEYVRNNEYIRFNDYLKKNGIRILWDSK